MIKYYFSLQSRLFNRHIISLGVQPVWGYLLLGLFFIILSQLVFAKLGYASYVYGFLAIQSSLFLADRKRNNFIKSCFNLKNYRQIRLIENVSFTIPFAIVLLIKNCYWESILLLFISAGISILNVKQSISFKIPTPFGRNPFEFLTGFRRTFLVFPISMYILGQAIYVHNFNLALGILVLVYLIIYSYYLNSEDKYFVWIYALSPVNFLKYKIFTAIKQSLIFIIPISQACLYISIETWYLIPLILMILNTFLITIILAKYSNYPDQISIPQGILLAISFMFPLLLFFTIPLFYKRAIRSLNQLLL